MSSIAEHFELEHCCGCGACVNACPVNAISYSKDEFGFVVPNVDQKKCVSCGKCVKVCPYQNSNTSPEQVFSPITYAAINTDADIAKNSSSGGVFYALAKSVIEKKGVVFGARMDDSFKVSHTCIETISDLRALQKSKYVQSFSGNSYSKVKSFLKDGRYVLFSGTPCQIAGLNSFLQNYEYEKLLTVEVVCHGVPNQDFFDDYRKNLELKIGKIKEYTFRYKMKSENGMKWYSSYITDKKRYVRNWPEDSYNYFYMKSFIYRDCCYSCKFASAKRQADITLCDYWHWNDLHGKDFCSKSSVSGIIVNSQKGLQFIDEISSNLKIMQSDFDYLASHNLSLVQPCGEKKGRRLLLEKWKKEGYATIDSEFKRKHWKQIFKYGILRLLPDGVLSSTHKVKKWISK